MMIMNPTTPCEHFVMDWQNTDYSHPWMKSLRSTNSNLGNYPSLSNHVLLKLARTHRSS